MGKNHDENRCTADGWEDDKAWVVSVEECEECARFDSWYIEFPITVSRIENRPIHTEGLGHKCGELCEVMPCGKDEGLHVALSAIADAGWPVEIHAEYFCGGED